MLTQEPGLDVRKGAAGPAIPCGPGCLGARCRERIYRHAQRLLRDPEDVEDLVQEVCMRCLVGQRRLRAGIHFRTWLHRAIVSACKTAQRQHGDAVLSAESASCREALDLAFQAPSTVPASEEAEEIVDSVRAALQRLAPRQRQLLEWRYVEGESFAEIADHLGIAAPSARPALHRARKAFKRAYEAQAREES
jgi:RNA polymerase sigma-70 factor, ECF subfamily